ncbi:MAG: NADP-dependent phosphogluconate dehydrogenase [Planctomycetes bacterium]|nr:NADP-dependent phosphogluconate dehydrogenase [Planctomycetota bacterium]
MANGGTASFGVVGLGVMGANLALNVESRGFTVAVYNRTWDKTAEFLAANPGKKLIGVRTCAELAAALEAPRRILLMVKAGEPVDQAMAELAPHLKAADIVVDGGNSLFHDTRRREAAWKQKGLCFVGCGISGGEEGARHGPSLMPGGDKGAYERLRPVFEAIAAKTATGSCVTWCGPDGAGHFVKMVHNGIEYGDMQLIAEAYDVLRKGLGLAADELGAVFRQWNQGPLDSFLIEITGKIFAKQDAKSGKALVDLVLDKAGQKGTGKWTAQSALDLGVAIPTIAAAIDARVLSGLKEQRVAAARVLPAPPPAMLKGDPTNWIATVHDALHAAKICAYAQGMSLIQAASTAMNWGIELAELARIWTGGCIIRARFLDSIRRAFAADRGLASLLLDRDFRAALATTVPSLRKVCAAATELGIPLPAFAASLAWYDSYRSSDLPQNLTQAQRDAFGAHTFERTDALAAGPVHADWLR